MSKKQKSKTNAMVNGRRSFISKGQARFSPAPGEGLAGVT